MMMMMIIIIIIIIIVTVEKRECKNTVIYICAFIYYTYLLLLKECGLVESGAVFQTFLLSSSSLHHSCFLKMEAADSSKTLVD